MKCRAILIQNVLVPWFHYDKASESYKNSCHQWQGYRWTRVCSEVHLHLLSRTCCAQASKLQSHTSLTTTAYKTTVSVILISFELSGVPMYSMLFREWENPMIYCKSPPYFVNSKPSCSSLVIVMLNTLKRYLNQAGLKSPDMSSKSTDEWNHFQRTFHRRHCDGPITY